MSSILKVDTIQDQDGNNIINESGNVITIGASGDTITVPAGATVSGFTSAGIDDNATSVAITIDSSERVGIGTTSPSQLLHLKSTTNEKPNLLIETENAGANGGRLDFLHKSSSPADGDLLGDITFGGYSDSGTPPSDFARYVMIKAFAEDVSNNAEKGRLTFSIHSGASNENNVDVLTLNGTNVGIGTTSPSTTLDIRSASPVISTVDTGDSNAVAQIDGNAGWLQLKADNNNTLSGTNITFSVDGSEKARIDASGNLLVGKTSTTYSDDGLQLNPEGLIGASDTNSISAIFNRNGTDGDIVNFRKDGTTNGQIGVRGNTLHIGSDDVGLEFHRNDDAIYPNNPSSNTLRDNSISLGGSSNRFLNLYLSSGVYLGGTGSANKLTDYEEGTFSPSISGNLGGASGVTFNIRNGFYTKVGRAVFFHIHIDLSSWTSGPSGSSTTINGLPFTNENTTGNNASVYIGQCNSWSGSAAPQGGYIQPNETRIILMTNDSSDARDNLNTSINTSTISGNEEIRIAGYYQTA